jgi:hypothetical protein
MPACRQTGRLPSHITTHGRHGRESLNEETPAGKSGYKHWAEKINISREILFFYKEI